MAYNLITGSGNFTLLSTDCLIGSASWTGSTTRDELYVQGQLKTDIFYDILGTSSLFVAKMNFSGSGEGYTYNYTGALSGSVTELQSGSYSDYYVKTWWGIPYDYLYTFDPATTTRSIDTNGQWSDVAGGAWKVGYHFATLHRKTNNKIVSLCAKYPVSSSSGNNTETYVSPGVNGFFCFTTGVGGLKADVQNETAPNFEKKAELRLIDGDVVIATTQDPPPPEPDPEPDSPTIVPNLRTAGFFFP